MGGRMGAKQRETPISAVWPVMRSRAAFLFMSRATKGVWAWMGGNFVPSWVLKY